MKLLTLLVSMFLTLGIMDKGLADELKCGGQVNFSYNIYEKIFQETQGKNFLISPYSASIALSMLAQGAKGDTKAEIDWLLGSSSFLPNKYSSDEDIQINVANSAWIRKDFKLKAGYTKILNSQYGADIKSVDFSKKSTISQINRWCAGKTNNKINNVLDRVDSNIYMLLMNALYFRASWEEPFDQKYTKEDIFYGEQGETKVDFMNAKSHFDYTEYKNNQILRLHYAGRRFSFFVVLPQKGEGDVFPISHICENHYRDILKSFQNKKVKLSLPKFKFSTELSLNSLLASMGMRKAFTPQADFSNISGNKVFVSEMKQSCFIEVNELGSEAAAVTSVKMYMTSLIRETKTITMNVNRPFIFAIVNNENGDLLFLGKISNLNNE